MVLIEQEDLDLARMLGLINLSEFVRDCITYFISGSERELTRSEIRELSKKFALEKRAMLQQQQKIISLTEEQRQQIEFARRVRREKIQAAVKVEIDRIGVDRFRKYMTDTYGDYLTIQEDCLAAISKETGFNVEIQDVLSVTGWRI